ncbi:hypothetical protein MPSEU_000089800 [Mayamaea pseudoterrestris]|nr:hypothetical protein MPSEU_000089800 [Mayamaea pseudoterrestris]
MRFERLSKLSAANQTFRAIAKQLRRIRHFGTTAVSCSQQSLSISVVECESVAKQDLLTQFQPFYSNQLPVVLREYALKYAAISKWKDLDYLLQAVGPHVFCDVEAGKYNQGERLTLPFDGYVEYLRLWQERYGSQRDEEPPSDQLLYLAQNDMKLFPELLNDIQVPNICSHCGEEKLYGSMLWLGPRGCVSPLHYDPLDNLLVQLVGRKRVTLISKDTDPERLYIGSEHGQQYNTSSVNVEDVDSSRFPLFAQVTAESIELHPGDALFIPSKWWHHARSLELSASVNFWWR